MHYQWTREDYLATVDAAKQINARAADLLLVEWSESRLEPWAQYPGGVAVGLIQITAPAAKAMGISEPERLAIPTLTPAQQAPYIVRYFKSAAGARVFGDAGGLYQAIAAPGTLSKGSANSVICYAAGSKAYAANPGLDANGDGEITVGDLRAHLATLATNAGFTHAIAELRGVDPSQGGALIGGGFTAGDVPAPIAPQTKSGPSAGAEILLALLGIGFLGVRGRGA